MAALHGASQTPGVPFCFLVSSLPWSVSFGTFPFTTLLRQAWSFSSCGPLPVAVPSPTLSFLVSVSVVKMQSFQKPENALKRANELLSIGQRDAALKILHNAIGHRRFRYVHPVKCMRPPSPCFVPCLTSRSADSRLDFVWWLFLTRLSWRLIRCFIICPAACFFLEGAGPARPHGWWILSLRMVLRLVVSRAIFCFGLFGRAFVSVCK